MSAQSVDNASAGPLDTLRVIEIGSVVAGPFATRLLGDYGADVIKVEAPHNPDPMRTWGQASYRGERLWWTVHGRNKRCITLDLRNAASHEIFLRLVATADVIVENFRPGTLERWNLGYERLREANAKIILCRLSGFGQTGPYRDRAGYASVAEAMGGLRAINGYPGQQPPRMAISLGDSLGGLYAAIGVLAALQHRQATGEGQVIDVALTEACMSLLESAVPEYDRLGHVRQPSGSRLEGIAPSNLFETRDGQWLVIAANQDSVFARLCEAIGRPELAYDPRFDSHVHRGDNQDELDRLLADWARQHDARPIEQLLLQHGVVVGPVYDVGQMTRDAHFQERDCFVTHHDERLDEDVLGPGIIPKFSASPGSVRWAGRPRAGADNSEVMHGLLGLPPETLECLKEMGVV